MAETKQPEAPEGKGKEMKNYVLLNKDGTDGSSVFTGHQPRQAALKAARKVGGTKDKPVEIQLRERGTKGKAHTFMAWKEQVPAPKNKPAWMVKDIITKANVKKVGKVKITKGEKKPAEAQASGKPEQAK